MKLPELSHEGFFQFLARAKMLYGAGCRSEVGFELKALGGKRVMICTDQGLVKAGVMDLLKEALAEEKSIKVAAVFDQIAQDARVDIINEAGKLYRKHKADNLIALGGGSVMDTAKAVNVLIGHKEKDFRPLAEQAALWETAVRLPPHIAFPTTAGTGSEITSAMVVLDPERHIKMGSTHPYCNADVAMLDPELTVSLPPRVTAFTGMDALTHAIEAITSTGREPVSDALALHAIRLVAKYLPRAVADGEDIEARGEMLLASYMAGMAFNNSMTGAVHGTAHVLGGKHGIPHGLANAVMLPEVMEFNTQFFPELYLPIADAMGVETAGLSAEAAAKAAVAAVRALKAEIGLADKLSGLGVPQDDQHLAELAEAAFEDSQTVYNCQPLEEEDIIVIYRRAL